MDSVALALFRFFSRTRQKAGAAVRAPGAAPHPHPHPHECNYGWIGYSNLTHICLNAFEANDLPVWFSSLQHLKSLEMCQAKFPQFPTCLIAMSGLEHLELDCLETYLSQDILGLA